MAIYRVATKNVPNKLSAHFQQTFSSIITYGSKRTVQQTSSKRPALHLLEVCWTFAWSCKHPINVITKHLPICKCFCLKHFCISHDTNNFCMWFIICVAACTKATPKRHIGPRLNYRSTDHQKMCWYRSPFFSLPLLLVAFYCYVAFFDCGCLMSTSNNLSRITFWRSLRFANGSRLPSQTGSSRYPKLNNVADSNLSNAVSILVSCENLACCFERNFESFWCGVMERYIIGFLIFFTSVRGIQWCY